MYQFDSRVRYSEVDLHGRLTWPALMDYFQDCSVFHSEQEDLSVRYLAENHIAWVLSSWQICCKRMPHLAEKITTQTWAYGMKSFYGYRNFAMRDEQGEMLACANSVWVLVDTKSGRPTRVPQEMADKYGIEPKLQMEAAPRRIKVPEECEKKEAFMVPSFFIDTNMHMNNRHYVEVAMGFLPEDFEISEVRVEYRRAAKEGDMLCPRVGVDAGAMVMALDDEEGNNYAVVQFIKSKR
jgi:acyl-ACP thioesterase